MEMICIEDGNDIYRVRKEEEGCSIFGPEHFIEGNDVLFDVLKYYSTVDQKEAFSILLCQYSVDENTLKNDLRNIANQFIENKILCETSNKILNSL